MNAVKPEKETVLEVINRRNPCPSNPSASNAERENKRNYSLKITSTSHEQATSRKNK
jgi:hypothetical protein